MLRHSRLELEQLEYVRARAEQAYLHADTEELRERYGSLCDALSDLVGALKREIEDEESDAALREANRDRAYGRMMTE